MTIWFHGWASCAWGADGQQRRQAGAAAAGGFDCLGFEDQCTFGGITPGQIIVRADSAVLPYRRMLVGDPAANPVNEFSVEIYDDFASGPIHMTFDLSQHTNYADCGLCLLGWRRLDAFALADAPTFMPLEGTATLEMVPNSPGDLFTIKLENVRMQQVTLMQGTLTTTPITICCQLYALGAFLGVY